MIVVLAVIISILVGTATPTVVEAMNRIHYDDVGVDTSLAPGIYATPKGNLKIVDNGEPTGAILYIQQIDPRQSTIGTVRFMAKNSAGEDTIFAEIYGAIESNEAEKEVGAIYFVVQQDGKDSIPLKIIGNQVIFTK